MKKVISIAALLAMGTAFVNAEIVATEQELDYEELSAALKVEDLSEILGVTVFYGSGGYSTPALDGNTVVFNGASGAVFKDVFYIAVPNVSRYEEIEINFNIQGDKGVPYKYNFAQPGNDFTPMPDEGITKLYYSGETPTETPASVTVVLPKEMYSYYVDEVGEDIPADMVLFALYLDTTLGATVTISEIGVLTSAIPEPSAFGLLAGLGALALVGTRRRRK